MKIILQPEARTISDRELANNQKYLINLLTKLTNLRFRLPFKARAKKFSIKYFESQAKANAENNPNTN